MWCALLWCLMLGSAQAGEAEAKLDPDDPKSMGTDRYWECRRMAGFVGGMLPTEGIWDFVGEGPIAVTGSPVLAFSCEVGGSRVAAFMGTEFAPWASQRSIGNKGELVGQWVTLSAGVTLGRNTLRYGPLVTGGWGFFGVGARLLVLPLHGPKGARIGLEVRALMFIADRVSGQVQLMWHFSSSRIRRARGG